MYQLTHRRPDTIAEASEMLAADPDAKILAGGMTLIPSLKHRLSQVTRLIDLSSIGGLSDISVVDGSLRIGALATHHDVARSEVVRREIPALADLAAAIGDSQVRNRGTLGGSVANNDPAADYPSAALALDAHIVTNHREIRAENFFLSLFTTALEESEIVVALEFPIPATAGYAKLPNPASRYAIVGVFCAQFATGCRVAVTGAGNCVFRWHEAEARLKQSFSVASIDGLILDAAELNSDLHADATYRAHVAGAMLEDAIARAIKIQADQRG